MDIWKRRVLSVLTAAVVILGMNITTVLAQSTVKVTRNRQVIDTFQGVEALYRPGGSDGSDSTYSCAALVKKYYAARYGKTPYNLLYNKTPIIEGGTFQKVTTPKVGDIVGYPNASRKCNHWAIVQGISGNNIILFEQNWKWQEGGVTYALSDHVVGKNSPVGNSSGYGNPVYFRYYLGNGAEVPALSSQTSSEENSAAATTKPQSLSLSKTSISVKTYFTYKLTAVIQNKKAGDVVTYTSSNKKIATVSSNGTVKGIRTGTTYITAKIKGTSISKKCKVKVTYGPRVISLNASRLTFVKVKTFGLKGKIYNKRSGDKIKYKSSNKRVATVTSKGVVKRKKKGTATITAWIPGTSTKKTCKVKVK